MGLPIIYDHDGREGDLLGCSLHPAVIAKIRADAVREVVEELRHDAEIMDPSEYSFLMRDVADAIEKRHLTDTPPAEPKTED